MGIRSLLRNAFGRSKAAREQSGAARDGADRAPESATIPEAREESVPAAAPDPEVPAARTAPAEAPVTAALPAQGSPVDEKAEAAPSVREEVTLDEEPAAADKPGETGAVAEADAVVETDAAVEPDAVVVADGPAVADEAPAAEGTATSEPTAPAEPTEEPKAAEPAEPAAAVDTTDATDTAAPSDDISALVSEAFDNPKPQPATETTEAKAETKPEVETKPEAETEPEAEAKPEPEAAPEAAAEPAPEATPEPETEPATEPEAEAATALSLTKVETTAPALVSLYKSASATLAKHNLATQRAAVYLVLDRSGSMRNYYKDGTVQNLAEQALGLSANLDDDGTVPVIFFSTDIDGTADIDLTNYEGRIEELHAGLGHMGRTNYHWAINAVVEHYKKSGSTAPAFVIFQTDGAPTSKPAAEKALCEAAELPIFWQFVGFGDPDAKGFDFLRKLDDLTVPEKRVVDNAGFFHAGRDPRSLSADELYGQLMVEFPEWLTEARTAGVLKDN
ncbi:vWA domain-containing protein [Streptomyces chattanoogensis]|uniref:vWA domain-containing protein n=1 Tax=Streptomyces chattanoogensis TaxID=66876 RepID=UPI0036B204B7